MLHNYTPLFRNHPAKQSQPTNIPPSTSQKTQHSHIYPKRLTGLILSRYIRPPILDLEILDEVPIEPGFIGPVTRIPVPVTVLPALLPVGPPLLSLLSLLSPSSGAPRLGRIGSSITRRRRCCASHRCCYSPSAPRSTLADWGVGQGPALGSDAPAVARLSVALHRRVRAVRAAYRTRARPGGDPRWETGRCVCKVWYWLL